MRKKRRRERFTESSYLTVNQKKDRKAAGVLRGISCFFLLISLAVIGYFVWQNYLRDSEILDRILHGDAEAETRSPGDTVPTFPQESTEDPEREKKAARAELEALKKKVHAMEPGFQFAEFSEEGAFTESGDPVLDEANRLAAGYDYDSAAAMIESVNGYGNNQAYLDALASYKARKAALKVFQINNNITHVFFHTLVVNPDLAFSREIAREKVRDYNKVMTTVEEFVKMMEEMYRKGYVLIDIYDLARMETQPDGEQIMKYQTILLPEGKTPFILSVDDTSYYEYMTGHGFPLRLVADAEGKVQNEYRLANGEMVTGSFDVLPILEDFISLHPDFSYRGARGIMALTGYNGVLGYRTCDFWYNENCSYYEPTDDNNYYKLTEISGPNPNIEEDKKTAARVAEAIKKTGWHFASHSWGHKKCGQVSLETLGWDADMWDREVRPIIGKTDLFIFPAGDDIGQTVSWKEYEYEGPNERYRLLKSHGFDYFFNVDSSVYYMQRTKEYFRQGRRNLDGERLWQAVYADRGVEGYKNRLGDLFTDCASILDKKRPDFRTYDLR